MPLDFYLKYAGFFQASHGIKVRQARVDRLDREGDVYCASIDDGTVICADKVLLALGFESFVNIPGDLQGIVGEHHSSHSSTCADPGEFAGKRLLIVGGRQSAFEYAALTAEAGASAVHVCHRHDTPAFAESDWAWVSPLLDRIADDPGWYRRLPDSERDALNQRFWAEGRVKLEPWLGPRVRHPAIHIRPHTEIVGSEQRDSGLAIVLNTGEGIEVDHVMFATGFKMDVSRIPLLKSGNLLDKIDVVDGFPRLDESLQTTSPGLFMTSLPAARDFGLFFAFTAAVTASARIVGRALS
jgi:thioredoxin reductase